MNPKLCPTCGIEIDADRPSGLCPACLLKEGLGTDTLGRDAPLQCTKCQSPVADGARFCGHCGAPAPSVSGDGDPIRAALESQLRGQYRIIRLLGRGGMGAVYLAKDLTLEREVAVKVVSTSSSAHETYDRFRREARTAARLSHPNIVPLLTFGEVEGMPYFVMGYVRGESLAARLQRDGKMAEEEGLRVLMEIADALDHAHRQGVVHRDIKPDNVLLEDESGRAVLTDFGVAKALHRGETLTLSGSVVGTPHYMSPEQASGQGDIDGRSDIYSLGVMAYAILSGRLPFEGATAADVLTRHLTQQPPSLRSLNRNLSHSTAQAVERCLAKDPSKRWPDAKSLRLALGANEESHLSDSLLAVEGRGVAALAIGMLLTLILALIALVDPDVAISGGVWIIGVTGFSYLFLLASLRREGFSVGQSQSVIFREPSWWLFWYPRALRRRGNVWDRLPAAVRHFRAWNIAVVIPAFLIALIGWLSIGEFDAFRYLRDPQGFISMSIVTIMLVLWFFLRLRAKRELQRKGLASPDIFRVLLSVPPSRVTFWARPHIAAILAPAAEAGRARRADSPHEHFQSILRYAGELSGPQRSLGAEAAAAGRVLLASIEDADREITELARSLEAGEEERLSVKIAALGGVDSAPLRTLLEKELELIRGLSERIEEAKETRSRRMEMLRTLFHHLAALRARSAESSDTSSVTDRVRALCDDIAAQAATRRA